MFACKYLGFTTFALLWSNVGVCKCNVWWIEIHKILMGLIVVFSSVFSKDLLCLRGVVLFQQKLFQIVIVHFHLVVFGQTRVVTIECADICLVLGCLLNQSLLLYLLQLLLAQLLQISGLHCAWQLRAALRLNLAV